MYAADPYAPEVRVRPGPSDVVDAEHERAGLGVADHRGRAWVDADPLKGIEVHAQGIGHDCLDDVPVGHDRVDRFGAVDCQSGVPVPDAATARADMAAKDSPSGPGKTAALG